MKTNLYFKRLKPYKEQLGYSSAETVCIYNYSKNGLTLQKCLDRANKVNLKLQVYNFDDDQDYKKTPIYLY